MSCIVSRVAAALVAATVAASVGAQAPALAGRVVDPAGRGVVAAGVALVELSPGWEAELTPDAASAGRVVASTVSDPDGAFRIAGPASRAWLAVRVEAPGRAPLMRAWERMSLAPDLGAPPRDLLLQVPPIATLEGLALDARGAPVSGARVTAACDSALGSVVLSSRTGADGRFRLEGLPALARVRMLAERDGAAARLETLLPPSGTARVALHLKPPREIAGTILQPGGEPRPLQGARIVELVVPERERLPWEADEPLPATLVEDAFIASEQVTAADGSFRMRLGPESRAVLLQPGFAPEVLGPGARVARAREPLRGVVVDAAGKPVLGAVVSIAGLPRAWTTDSAGAFLAPVTAGALRVDAPGDVRVETPARAGSVRMPLPARRMIAGSVRRPPQAGDTEAQPLGGATIRFALDDAVQAAVGADDAGAFRALLPRTPRRVGVSAPGHAAARDVGAASASSLAAWLVPAALPLEVRVSAGGKPAPGAAVIVAESGLPRSPALALAGADGIAPFPELHDAAWSVSAVATGALPRTTIATPAGRHDVDLRPAARLRVRCMDGEGRPLEGVAVTARGDGVADSRATERLGFRRGMGARVAGSGPDGIATIEGLMPGECVDLEARRPALAPVERRCERASTGDAPPIELRFVRAAGAHGRVVDLQGAPVPGAIVSAHRDGATADASADGRRAWRQQRRAIAEAVADATGAWSLRDLAPGRVEIRAKADGFRESEPLPADLLAGEDVALDVRLDPGAAITGVVRRADGSVASGASIRTVGRFAGPSMRGGPRAEADDEGAFAIAGLEPGGERTLEASLDGETSERRVGIAGGDPVTLTLVAKGRIEGRVTGAEDVDATVTIRCSGVPEGHGEGSADVEGAFVVQGLPAGTYACIAVAGDQAEGSVRDVAVSAGKTTNVTIPLGPRATQEILVLGPSGEPISGARVREYAGFGSMARTSSSGRALLALAPRVDGGTRRIEAAADRHAVTTVALTDPRPSVLEIRMQSETRVSGVLLDAASQPVAGVEIRAVGSRATSEPDGTFALGLRQAGRINLVASRTTRAAIETARLELDVPAQGLSGVELRLVAEPTGSLLVLVVDGDAPLPRARVALVHESAAWGGSALSALAIPPAQAGQSASGATDEEGTFLGEGLRSGDVTILVGRPEESTLRAAGHARVLPGQEVTVRVSVPPGDAVTGRVVRGGAGLEGVNVYAFPWSSAGWQRGAPPLAMATSSAGGAFSLGPFPPSTRKLFVRAEPEIEGARNATAEAVPGGPPIALDVGGATLAGEVRRDGEPVSGARVRARSRDDASYADTRTTPGGGWRLQGLDPSTAYDVTASDPDEDAAPASRTVTTPGAGGIDVIDPFELGASAELRGTAVHASGAPVAGLVLVLVRPTGERLPDVLLTPAADGTWSTPVRPGEKLTFRAATRDASPIVGEAEPGVPLALVFRDGADLTLQVSDAEAVPVRGASVRLASWEGRPVDGRPIPSQLLTLPEAGGALRVRHLMPGTSTLLVSAEGTETTVTVTLADGERRTLPVRLP